MPRSVGVGEGTYMVSFSFRGHLQWLSVSKDKEQTLVVPATSLFHLLKPPGSEHSKLEH